MEVENLLELLNKLERAIELGHTVVAKRMLEQEINNLKRSNRAKL